MYLASQAMESFIFEVLVGRWAGEETVAYLAHDQDQGLNKVVRDAAWDICEFLDRNHVMKSWDTMWKRVAYINEGSRGRNLDFMVEIQGQLKRWFYVALKLDDSDEVRAVKWRECIQFFSTGENGWSAWDDEHAIALLTQFVESMVPMIPQIRSGFSTQLCECLNSMAAKLANKQISWRGSFEARVCVAVLNFNEGHRWQLRLYDELAALFNWRSLPERCRARLEADFAAMERKIELRAIPENAVAANADRFARRHRQWMSLQDARQRGLPLYQLPGEVIQEIFKVNDLGLCPLRIGFLNDSLVCHCNAPLVATLSIGPIAEFIRERAPHVDSETLTGALQRLLLACWTETFPHDADEVRACVTTLAGADYFNEVRDPIETYQWMVAALCQDTKVRRRGIDRGGMPTDASFQLVETGAAPKDKSLRRVCTIRVRACDVARALVDLANYEVTPAWARATGRWPIVLAIGVESARTDRVNLPTWLTIRLPEPVREDKVSIVGFEYELVSYVRRTVSGKIPHATARVLLSKAEDRLEWRFYDDWRKVSVVATEAKFVADNIRLAFYLRREVHVS